MDSYKITIKLNGKIVYKTCRANDLTHAWKIAQTEAAKIHGVAIDVYADL